MIAASFSPRGAHANLAVFCAATLIPYSEMVSESLEPHVASRADLQRGRDSQMMRLVPREEHTPGSDFWTSLHPNGYGGYSEWAIPNGARPNR
jgi:hypothetical protein